MEKAIILSGIELTEEERELLKNTDIYKLALNHHAEELKPDERIFSDYVDFGEVLRQFPGTKIYTVRYIPRHPVENLIVADVEFKGSTIIAAIEFLIKRGVKKILLIADNTVHAQSFRDEIYNNILKLPTNTEIYQFRTGNFPLPVLGIRDFIWNT